MGVTWHFMSFYYEQPTASYLDALCSYAVGVGGSV
jgi:hypothetical protein